MRRCAVDARARESGIFIMRGRGRERMKSEIGNCVLIRRRRFVDAGGWKNAYIVLVTVREKVQRENKAGGEGFLFGAEG